MTLPTIFFVTDCETTMRKRMVFDIAWNAIDRRGRSYGQGSYVIKEAFHHDVPYFSNKLGMYFEDSFKQLIEPATISQVRDEYNRQVSNLQKQGYRVILCAFNAAFDFTHIPESYRFFTNKPSASWMKAPVELMDIWQHWGDSVPKKYKKVAPPSESGKYLSTSAENAYRFEFNNPHFEEKHIAWDDVRIESELLVKALSRKKPMHVVTSPSQFIGSVWKRINTRLGITGKTMLVTPENSETVLGVA